MVFATPDLSPEQQKQKQEDEGKIGSFMRYNKGGRATRGIGAKRAK